MASSGNKKITRRDALKVGGIVIAGSIATARARRKRGRVTSTVTILLSGDGAEETFSGAGSVVVTGSVLDQNGRTLPGIPLYGFESVDSGPESAMGVVATSIRGSGSNNNYAFNFPFADPTQTTTYVVRTSSNADGS